MGDKIFITTMYRWGSHENHSYVLGAYTTKDLAIKAGEKNSMHRGGKYEAEVIEVELDCEYYTDDRKLPDMVKALCQYAK